MKRRDEKLERLQQLPLFASCDERELSEIAKLVDETSVPEGRVLIAEDSTNCREAFIILEGQASVSVRGVQVAVVGPGGCLGEMAVIDHERRSATVTALTDLTLLVIDARGLHALVEKHGVGWKLMKEMGLRVRALEAEGAPL
jgi:CRP/FNR family transcriptional regulator, cyclic AMP receptor protein